MLNQETTYQVAEQLVDTSAGDIHVLKCGSEDNQLLIILHGYDDNESNKDWKWILPFLAEAGFYVIAPSMPGFGKSPGPRSRHRSEYQTLPGGPVSIVNDLIAAFNEEDAVLIGYDWGAGTAICFASLYPQKVISLVLFHITFTDYGDVLSRVKCESLILWVKGDTFHPYSQGLKFKVALKKNKFVTLSVGAFKEDKMNQNYRYIGDKIILEMTNFLKDEKIWVNAIQNIQAIESSQTQPIEQKTEEVITTEPQGPTEEVITQEKLPVIKEAGLDQKVEEQKEEANPSILAKEEEKKQVVEAEPSQESEQDQIDIIHFKEPLNEKEKSESFDAEKIKSVIELTRRNSFEVKELTKLIRKIKPKKPKNQTTETYKPRTASVQAPMTTEVGKLEIVKTRGGDIVVNVHGPENGIPFFIFHGWEVSTYSHNLRWMFDPIAKEGFRVYAPDMPGFGRSAGKRHSCRSEMNFDKGGPIEIVEDLLSHYKAKIFWAFGFSWGGGIAISLALNMPNRCKKIVLYMPSYTEQKTELKNISQETFIMWVPVDIIHPVALGRYFKTVIPKVTFTEVDVGKYEPSMENDEYGKFSNKLLPPMISFIRKNK